MTRKCQHRCRAIRRTGGQCTRLAALHGKDHHLIRNDENPKGIALCAQHNASMFNHLLGRGPLHTLFGACVQEMTDG